MTIEEKTAEPALPEKKTKEGKRRGADEIWEYCKGQCGADPWCMECMRNREKLQEEWLNRQGRSDDKKE